MNETYAELSKALFWPATTLLYAGAMIAYLYGMAFTRVAVGQSTSRDRAGTWGIRIGTTLASLGLATHLGHLIFRSLASNGRVPWGNMFEYSSVSAFGVVAAGLFIFQWRMRKPEVMGFLLLGGLLTMGAALLVWTDPGPLMPILESQWLKIHVFTIMLAATVFTVGFVFNGLHLLREVAESRLASRTAAAAIGSTVGAAYAGSNVDEGEAVELTIDQRELDLEAEYGVEDHDRAYGRALRDTISPVRLFAWTWVATASLSWVFWANEGWSTTAGMSRFFTVNTTLALAAVVAWWFLPKLPAATTLDSLTYRTISFAFPIWTFAVIAGAIWAEQAWGRYWGWDPKETSAFLTWVAYAGYLHARVTRGMRGRNASILGIVSFAVLMFTYFAVNLVISGLHSYAGL